jgi:hypothetical protein
MHERPVQQYCLFVQMSFVGSHVESAPARHCTPDSPLLTRSGP